MELRQALTQRRMRRAFTGEALDADLVTELFADSLRAPTAGHARGISWVTMIGSEEVARYFAAATDETWRSNSKRFEGLQRASAIGICLASPERYRERYGASDKASSGLGETLEAWPVPYWIGDAGAACFAALLLAEDQGLGGCFLGAFRNLQALRELLNLDSDDVIYGAVLIGPASEHDYPSASLTRPGPTRQERVRRVKPQR